MGHKMLAEVYQKEGGMRRAIDEYVTAIDIKKNDYKSYFKIAQLLKDLGNNIWETLVRPARRVKVGTVIKFSDRLSAKCIGEFDDGMRHFEMIYDGILLEILKKQNNKPKVSKTKTSLVLHMEKP